MPARRPRIPIEIRFWQKVAKRSPSECWLWVGAEHGSQGYGGISINAQSVPAHRVAYTLERGPIPAGLFVCHHCDVPKCCNPAHLFLGTQQDNMDDMAAKGRGKAGCEGYMPPEKVLAARMLYRETDWTIKKIARKLNAVIDDVDNVVNWRTRRNIT